MNLNSLRIRNFRGISKLELEFTKGVNVLVGVNGAGKTAVLDCAAVLLSRLISRIRSSEGAGRHFTDSDISNGSPVTRNEVNVSF